MTPRLLTFVFAVLAALPLYARIGETEEQIEKRYGKPISEQKDQTGGNTRVYKASQFVILCTFWKGVSAYEAFKRENGTDLTDAQIEFLLDTNSPPSRKWLRIATSPNSTWATKKADRVAMYIADKHMLTISTREFMTLSKVAREYEEVAPLKDF